MEITIDEIKENLRFAADVMKRMPPVKVEGYFCTWPKFYTVDEDMENLSEIWLPPLPEEIKTMEEILEWLKYTSLENRRIAWLKACGMGWKQMEKRYKTSRSTLARQYKTALNDIKENLENDENLKKSLFRSNNWSERNWRK